MDDAHGLAAVRACGCQVGYAGIVDEGFLAAMSIDKNEERWRQVLDAHGASQTTLVAAVDDRMVRFASIGPYRSEAGDGKALDASRGL